MSRLDRPDVPFLYKYSSPARLDWLETILFKNEIYFPSPAQLRDPSDARPRLVVSSKERALRTIVNPFLTANRFEPLDVLARHVRNIIHLVNTRDLNQLSDWVTPLFHRHMERHRIYSMTTRPDNEYLWRHYAANHTGYCLEFHSRDVFAFALSVAYGDAVELEFNLDTSIDATFLFCKTRQYEPEEEVRILLMPSGHPHEVSFDPSLLRRVILGKHMREEDRRTISDWCRARMPAVVVEEEELESAVFSSV